MTQNLSGHPVIGNHSVRSAEVCRAVVVTPTEVSRLATRQLPRRCVVPHPHLPLHAKSPMQIWAGGRRPCPLNSLLSCSSRLRSHALSRCLSLSLSSPAHLPIPPRCDASPRRRVTTLRRDDARRARAAMPRDASAPRSPDDASPRRRAATPRHDAAPRRLAATPRRGVSPRRLAATPRRDAATRRHDAA